MRGKIPFKNHSALAAGSAERRIERINA